MNRAVELSKKGYGFVNPNPLVGAVIVKNGKVIGEGFHEFFGGPHAEINALKNVVKATGCDPLCYPRTMQSFWQNTSLHR